MACNVKIDESRLYRDIYPPSTGDLQWQIRLPQDLKQMVKSAKIETETRSSQQDIRAEIHDSPKEVQTHTPTEQLLPTPDISQEVPVNVPTGAPELRKTESKTKHLRGKRRNRVKIRDAKGTDEEMDSSTESETSSDETDSVAIQPLTDRFQVTYRSVDLSDCSLPFSDQEGTPPTDSSEGSTKGP